MKSTNTVNDAFRRNFFRMAAFVVVSALLFSACGDTSDQEPTGNGNGEENSDTQITETTLDTEIFSQALIDGITFQDELSPLSEGAFRALYAVDETDMPLSFSVYASSGATAEEVAVLECRDREHAEYLSEKAAERIESQKIGFENYVPEELVKLENAVLYRTDQYVVLCISDEEAKAEKIIKEFI